MSELNIIAEGLGFPEGPVALSDGSVVVVELAHARITRIAADGTKTVVAEPGGGPNGLAVGPDGKLYCANNGGSMTWVDHGGLMAPGPHDPSRYSGGRIERIDLDTGAVEVVYDSCDGRPLRSPNDIVFDDQGGFWFTDLGITFERTQDRTGLFYGKADGSSITEAIFPLDCPNGIGLSPDGKRLYTAETFTGRLISWELSGPGTPVLIPGLAGHGGTVLRGLGGEREMHGLDSLAVDGEGWVCVGTLMAGGITAVDPTGGTVEFYPTGDPLTTNICFGGPDLRTAFVTLSGTGRLASMPWPRPGLALAHSR
ncbi:SMP-30/gluconolactonase/LRE family protein [Mycobacterium sp. pV006]|uniref:SMP-30/gluconolactonase/LRE family protein n=1 Tax=Mycobacterium sp. pV006 TaxID=3238983 RepID=UPI00351B2DBC